MREGKSRCAVVERAFQVCISVNSYVPNWQLSFAKTAGGHQRERKVLTMMQLPNTRWAPEADRPTRTKISSDLGAPRLTQTSALGELAVPLAEHRAENDYRR